MQTFDHCYGVLCRSGVLLRDMGNSRLPALYSSEAVAKRAARSAKNAGYAVEGIIALQIDGPDYDERNPPEDD